jgi:hypothetical protein
MKPLILALALLLPQPVGQKQIPAPDGHSSAQQKANPPDRVTVEDKPAETKHEPARPNDNERNLTGSPQPQPSPPPRPRWIEHPLLRFMSLADTDRISCALFVVTSLYFFATVGILFAMRRSNKHAEKTSKESSETVTAVIRSATEFAGVAIHTLVGQYETMTTQTETMQTQARALIASAEAAVASADVTRRQFEAYDRPWITGSIVFKEPVTFEPNGTVEMWVYPVIKNVGKSVAIDISPTCKLITIPRGHPDFLSFVTEQMQAVSRDPAQRNVGALFPGDTNDRTMNRVRVSSEEIATGSFTHGDATRLSLVCICAIFYRFANSTADHVTRFAYHIGQSNPMRTGGDMNIRVGTRIQSSEIITLPHPFSYAD